MKPASALDAFNFMVMRMLRVFSLTVAQKGEEVEYLLDLEDGWRVTIYILKSKQRFQRIFCDFQMQSFVSAMNADGCSTTASTVTQTAERQAYQQLQQTLRGDILEVIGTNLQHCVNTRIWNVDEISWIHFTEMDGLARKKSNLFPIFTIRIRHGYLWLEHHLK